ncbi:hypothetical protein F4775DRAFT_412426 [Biscogniauxia sp. FL1348]|nr:hypothetical protein F4775DRAFT_412426 [Biscogniauxia sp. FL1348]
MSLLRIPFNNMPEFLSAPPHVPSPSPPSLPPRPPPQSRPQRRHRRHGHCHPGGRKGEKKSPGLRHDGLADKLDQICKILGRLVDVLIEDKVDRTLAMDPALYRPWGRDRTDSEKGTRSAQIEKTENGSLSPDPHHTTTAARVGAIIIGDKLEEPPPRVSAAPPPLPEDIAADLSWLHEDLTSATEALSALYRTAESAPAEALRFAVRQLAGALSAHLRHISDRLHEAVIPPLTPDGSGDGLPEAIPVPTSLAPSAPGLTVPVPNYGATRNGRPVPVYPGVNGTGALGLDGRADADWDILEDMRTGRSGMGSGISL